MKQFIAIMVVMVLASGSIMAQSNNSAVDQTGSGNGASVSQTGFMLTSNVDQDGMTNTAVVLQSGNGAGTTTQPTGHIPNTWWVAWPSGFASWVGALIWQDGDGNNHRIRQSGNTGGAGNQNVAAIYANGDNNHTTATMSTINDPLTPIATPYSIEQNGMNHWAWMQLNGNNNNTAIKQGGGNLSVGEIWINGNGNEALVAQNGTYHFAQLVVFSGNLNRQYATQDGYQSIMRNDITGSGNGVCVDQIGTQNWEYTVIIGDGNLVKSKQDGYQNTNDVDGSPYTDAPPFSTITGNGNEVTFDQIGTTNWVFFNVTGNGNNAGQDGLPRRTFYQNGTDNKSVAMVTGSGNMFWSEQIGDNNTADLKVWATSNGNKSQTTQHGNGNNADVDQTGNLNESYIVTTGNLNGASVTQTVGGNVSTVNQLGNSNNATVVQN